MYHPPANHAHAAHPVPAHAHAAFTLKKAHAGTPIRPLTPRSKPPAQLVARRPGAGLLAMIRQIAGGNHTPYRAVQLTAAHQETIRNVAQNVIPAEEVGWIAPYAARLRQQGDEILREERLLLQNKAATPAQITTLYRQRQELVAARKKLCWEINITPAQFTQMTDRWRAQPAMTQAEQMADVLRLSKGMIRSAKSSALGTRQFITQEWDTLARQHSEALSRSANPNLQLIGLYGANLKRQIFDPDLKAQAYALRADPEVAGQLSELMMQDKAQKLLAAGIAVNSETLLVSQIFGDYAIKLSRLRATPSVTFGALAKAGVFPAAFVFSNPAPCRHGLNTTIGQFWEWVGAEVRKNTAPQPAPLDAMPTPSVAQMLATMQKDFYLPEDYTPQQFQAAYRQAAATGGVIRIDMRDFSTVSVDAPGPKRAPTPGRIF